MHNPYRSIPMNSVDIESELRGQNLDLTKCPEKKFDPSKQKPVTVNLNDCDNTLVPVYTRLNNATNIFSGITINRFNPLHENLQTNIHQNSYIGVNTRLLLKDVFSSKK
jgi:type 1 fimbria pilin